MADFEDANSPTWANKIEGQINLKDRWAGKIDFTDPQSGKDYELGDQAGRADRAPARLASARGASDRRRRADVRRRCSISASTSSTTPRRRSRRAPAPYFYLPKMESHHEARLWNDVFLLAQEQLGMPAGTIKATVLIETLPAAFEMDEILYELRDHIAGLNCRPLGLHLLLHQDASPRIRTTCCPTARRW